MAEASIELLPHQLEFLNDNETRYLALCGGYGCGKTYSFCVKAINLALLNPGCEGAVLEPTIDMARRVLVPEMSHLLEDLGVEYVYKKADKEFLIVTDEGISKIHVLSAENYTRLVGLNLAWWGVDEVDTIRNKDIAHDMFDVLISRLRDMTATNIQGYFTSTPEGFHFLYDVFVKEVAEAKMKNLTISNRRLIKGKTSDNPYLAEGYIESMVADYNPQQAKAYLEGEFVNLTSGTVYYTFDREFNHSDLTVDSAPLPLHIGMDFNVGKCSAVVHLIIKGLPVAVDEIQGILNTEYMIQEIKRRYPNRAIIVYPDASGNSGKTNSSATDIALLVDAKFKVVARSKNPYVKDRINCMNAMFLNNKGERRYLVNTRTCPLYTQALEQQAYNKYGEPDKTHDQDHPNDASGYFIFAMYPIKARAKLRVR